jgi:hypothetical protein
MAGVKLVVMYPRPKDVAVFEKIYQDEHVPLAVAKLGGKTKIVATKILEACAASEGGKEALAHAVKIAWGGAPILLVARKKLSRSRKQQSVSSNRPKDN